MTEFEECLLGALWVAALLAMRQWSRSRGWIAPPRHGKSWTLRFATDMANVELALGFPPRSLVFG